MTAWLFWIAVGAATAAGWRVSLRLWPNTRCRRCDGNGRNAGQQPRPVGDLRPVRRVGQAQAAGRAEGRPVMAVDVCKQCNGTGKAGTRADGSPAACKGCGGFGCLPLPPPKKKGGR